MGLVGATNLVISYAENFFLDALVSVLVEIQSCLFNYGFSFITGSNRGRFVNGRGSGFRNEGVRGGRGNYGGSGGRGYNRSDFNGRTEFGNNRGSNRGGFSNRGGDGYQRADNNGGSGGGRANRGGGMGVNGTAKTLPPRVSATA